MQEASPGRAFGWRELAVLGSIAILGLVTIRYPFDGDQALFTIGAVKLHHGALLYRDFWDLKQPGIYLFYMIAGTLFGFSDVGVNCFALLYLLAFAAVLQLALRPYVRSTLGSAVAPLLIVGVYYAVATPYVLTQVEALIGVPLFLALWLCYAASRREGYARLALLALAGIAGAAVVLLKLIDLVVLVAVWAAIFVTTREAWGRAAAARMAAVATLLAGLLLPLAGLWVAYAPAIGAAVLYETFILYPQRVVRELPAQSTSTLLRSARWFADNFAGLLVLASIGAAVDLRRRVHPVTAGLVAWFVAGVVMFLLQRDSWWLYQLTMLSVPIGILATLGIEAIVARLMADARLQGRMTRPAIVLAVLTIFCSTEAVKAAAKIHQLVGAHFAATPAALQAYQFGIQPMYREAAQETAFLSGRGSLRGDIYVMGSPIYYLFARRSQAIALNGSSVQLWLRAQWDELQNELGKARPPYVFVRNDFLALMEQRSPRALSFIERRYRRMRADAHGAWYGLRSSRPHADAPFNGRPAKKR